MLKHDLGYYHYKLQIVQQLRETNFTQWKDFCGQFLHLQFFALCQGSKFIWAYSGEVGKSGTDRLTVWRAVFSWPPQGPT